jgi:hypothetical protein
MAHGTCCLTEIMRRVGSRCMVASQRDCELRAVRRKLTHLNYRGGVLSISITSFKTLTIPQIVKKREFSSTRQLSNVPLFFMREISKALCDFLFPPLPGRTDKRRRGVLYDPQVQENAKLLRSRSCFFSKQSL